MRMKILFLSESYFPNVSGVPIVVRYLAEGLVKLNNEVSIITTLSKGTTDIELIGGVNVYRFNLYKDHLNFYHGEKDKFVEFVVNFDCDVVIFECLQCVTTDLLLPHLHRICARKILHSHGISGMRIKLFEKKKNFLHTLANTYHFFYYKWYFNCVLARHINSFDKVLCLSEVDNTITYCAQYGIRTEILGNAVEDLFVSPTNPIVQKDISELKLPYFLSLAYYSQIKNQIGILREFYKAKITNYALVFIGPTENRYYEELLKIHKQLETQYGHREVLFLTHVDRSFIPDIVGNAELYLVGSTIEQFSIAITEAMAKGIPFISTNVGNARLLPGGITVNSIDEMHIAIRKLIEEKLLYRQLSNKGLDYVRKFCRRDVVIKKLDTIIKNLVLIDKV